MLRIEVPPLMKNILKEINKAVLKAQSSFEDPDKIMTHDEIVEFLAVYLNTMSRLRDSTGENPLEMTVDIEEFEDQGDFIDLHITESDYTSSTKPDPTISSIASLTKSANANSQSSLESQKSAEKSQLAENKPVVQPESDGTDLPASVTSLQQSQPSLEKSEEKPSDVPLPEKSEEEPLKEPLPEKSEEVPLEEPLPEKSEEVPSEEPLPEKSEEKPSDVPLPEKSEEEPLKEPLPEKSEEEPSDA
ncbi:cell surface glycoprotein 1-like isoform X2 [Bolinopsis microptera]|uniref:cell surface glycoprotein 1-like isoform X2 n=1 Tax=Bolinopsis microptera TaxID=2820187 RepID=UPI0030796797